MVASEKEKRDGVEMGVGCKVGEYVVFGEGCKVGSSCRIGSFVRIGAGCVVGNGVTLKDGVIIAEGSRIGNGAFLGPNTVVLREQVLGASGPEIGERCFIGGLCSIMANVGAGSVVGANSFVRWPVGRNRVMVGSPARDVSKRGVVGDDRG